MIAWPAKKIEVGTDNSLSQSVQCQRLKEMSKYIVLAEDHSNLQRRAVRMPAFLQRHRLKDC